jgi:hypothetical protein
MAVSVEEVKAEVMPEPVESPGGTQTGRTSQAPDMDRICLELRRCADRLERLWTD